MISSQKRPLITKNTVPSPEKVTHIHIFNFLLTSLTQSTLCYTNDFVAGTGSDNPLVRPHAGIQAWHHLVDLPGEWQAKRGAEVSLTE